MPQESAAEQSQARIATFRSSKTNLKRAKTAKWQKWPRAHS